VINAARVFARHEIQPLQTYFAQTINEWMGEEVCRFDPYMLPSVEPAQQGLV